MRQRKNRCAQEDDFNALYEVMARADGLIVGSPVYFGSATPDLMALLDRAGYVARMGDNVFARKVGTPLVGGPPGRRQLHLRPAPLLHHHGHGGAGLHLLAHRLRPGTGEVLKDEEGMKTMTSLAENFAWLLKKVR